jgi:hypothetical protein
VKSELADLSLSQSSFKKSLEGVIQTIIKNESAADFWQYGRWTVAKSPDINEFLK